jgi:hypothetical protein
MPSAPSSSDLARLLPGTWAISATNFPMWLTRERLSPTVTYELVSEDPLTLTDDVAFTTEAGEEKHILGVDRWNGEGFTWKGKKLLRFFPSHWSIIGMSDDETVLVVRFEKTIGTPAGIDIIVREGTTHPELRSLVAHNSVAFGLTAEDFASLTWQH